MFVIKASSLIMNGATERRFPRVSASTKYQGQKCLCHGKIGVVLGLSQNALAYLSAILRAKQVSLIKNYVSQTNTQNGKLVRDKHSSLLVAPSWPEVELSMIVGSNGKRGKNTLAYLATSSMTKQVQLDKHSSLLVVPRAPSSGSLKS
jgi:hypothetical protein